VGGVVQDPSHGRSAAFPRQIRALAVFAGIRTVVERRVYNGAENFVSIPSSSRERQGVARPLLDGGWSPQTSKGDTAMLWTIFVILLILWLLGVVSKVTLGGFIHVLLLIAIAAVLIRIIQGRRPI
jgi:hypothetical protein